MVLNKEDFKDVFPFEIDDKKFSNFSEETLRILQKTLLKFGINLDNKNKIKNFIIDNDKELTEIKLKKINELKELVNKLNILEIKNSSLLPEIKETLIKIKENMININHNNTDSFIKIFLKENIEKKNNILFEELLPHLNEIKKEFKDKIQNQEHLLNIQTLHKLKK